MLIKTLKFPIRLKQYWLLYRPNYTRKINGTIPWIVLPLFFWFLKKIEVVILVWIYVFYSSFLGLKKIFRKWQIVRILIYLWLWNSLSIGSDDCIDIDDGLCLWFEINYYYYYLHTYYCLFKVKLNFIIIRNFIFLLIRNIVPLFKQARALKEVQKSKKFC